MTTIVLGGVTLNPSMRWAERYASQGVAQAVQRTLGGLPVFFNNSLTKAETITIETWADGGAQYGLLRRSVVDEIMALAAVVGGQYVLAFNGVNTAVVFRHSDPPAVDMQPIAPRTADDDDDYMSGRIKLLTI